MTNNDLVQRSDDLDARLQEVNLNVEELMNYGHRNRSLIRWTIISVAFDILLTLGLVIVFMNQQNAQNQIINSHNSLVSICKSSNEFRTDNLSLWNYILNITPQQPQTPEQQKQTADFKAFLNKTFMVRDCSVIK